MTVGTKFFCLSHCYLLDTMANVDNTDLNFRIKPRDIFFFSKSVAAPRFPVSGAQCWHPSFQVTTLAQGFNDVIFFQ